MGRGGQGVRGQARLSYNPRFPCSSAREPPGQATPNLTAARRQDRSRRKTQSGPACESAVNVDRVRVHDQIPPNKFRTAKSPVRHSTDWRFACLRGSLQAARVMVDAAVGKAVDKHLYICANRGPMRSPATRCSQTGKSPPKEKPRWCGAWNRCRTLTGLGRQTLGGMPLVVISARPNRYRFARHIRHGHRAVHMGSGLDGRRCGRCGLRTVAPGLIAHA